MIRDITLIAAVSADGFIGKDGGIPWPFIKSDIQNFKRLTTGNVVIMGRGTFKSMNGKPLPNRDNIVISSGEMIFNETWPNVAAVKSVPAALDLARAISCSPDDRAKEVYIIGGQSIYEQTIGVARRLIITHLDSIHVGDGDVTFPAIPPSIWGEGKLIGSNAPDEPAYRMREYIRQDG